MMPKDPVPVEIPDSVSTSPDEDSDSLPQPETEDEEGLESEVGPYMESLENLVRFSFLLKLLTFIHLQVK